MPPRVPAPAPVPPPSSPLFGAIKSAKISFFTSAKKPEVLDMDPILGRSPVGVNMEVLQSFFVHRSEFDPSVGIIGWSFEQNGLRYGCQIKDDYNNDVYNFGVEVPTNQPYLHQLDRMCIAEKAHVLSIVSHLMGPDQRAQMRAHLYELEKICSHPNYGIVVRNGFAHHLLHQAGKLNVGVGVVFPEDVIYTEQPSYRILALDWYHRDSRQLIDLSGVFPSFLIGRHDTPIASMDEMTRAEALKAIKLAEMQTKNDPVYHMYREEDQDLIGWLTMAASWLPEQRVPKGP